METHNDQALVDRFVDVVEYLNRRTLSGRLDDWAQLGMTTPQIKTLAFLEERGPARMGMIASHLGTSLSATTSVVDRLVEKRMLQRASDPGDRRVVICELTSTGLDAVNQFWRIGQERILPAVRLLDAEQLAAAVRGLELIRVAEEELQRRRSEEEATS